MLGTRLLELTAVVSRLHRVCPWTKTQSASDMIAHTRNELAEVEEAMAACASGSGEEAAAPSRAHLEAELGDVLFDVLMLIEAASKEYGTAGLEEVCEHSIRKLRRRAPYAFEGGPAVVTTADAEVLWQVRRRHRRTFTAACTYDQQGSSLVPHLPTPFHVRPHFVTVCRRARPRSWPAKPHRQ